VLEKPLVLAPSIVVDAGLNESARVAAASHIPHEAPSLDHGDDAQEVFGVAGLARLANALESVAQGGEKLPAGTAGAMELPAPAATGPQGTPRMAGQRPQAKHRREIASERVPPCFAVLNPKMLQKDALALMTSGDWGAGSKTDHT